MTRTLRTTGTLDGPRVAGRIVASSVVLLTMAGMATIVVVDSRLPVLSNQDPLEGWSFMLAFIACALTGAAVLRRYPGHALGWLITFIGVIPLVAVPLERWGTYTMLTTGQPDLATIIGFWLNSWYWYVLLALVLVFLPLLFPTGRLPSSRWRAAASIPVVAVIAMVVMGVLQPTIGSQEDRSIEIRNPTGLSGVPHPEESLLGALLIGGFFFGMVVAVAAIVVRFRRAESVERQQLKWFFVPVMLLPLPFVVDQLSVPQAVTSLSMPLTIASFPVAIGIAITRYHLYDLGRLVSRTVSYVVIVAVLVSLYAGAVLLLGAASRGVAAEQSDLVVAVSTLLVAAVFQPLRRRVQTLVERRFNRSRYDAVRTVEAFGAQLRDEMDLDALAYELRSVSTRSVEPAAASVWLRRVSP